jgi:hypothetical protein
MGQTRGREPKDERAQSDAREPLDQRRNRRTHPGNMTQPNRDLEHDRRNRDDLDLDDNQGRRQRGINQLPSGDPE